MRDTPDFDVWEDVWFLDGGRKVTGTVSAIIDEDLVVIRRDNDESIRRHWSEFHVL